MRQDQPGGRPALLSVCLGFFVIQLDVTIVNVALPAMGREVGGSTGGLQWVVDAYTLALAAVMLTAGSLADRTGARRVFLTGLAVFGLGSAACAAAPSLGLLIAARAVQGLGASALVPCSLALIVHQFPDPRARARALGVWGGLGAVAVAAGPVLGGILVAAGSWRLIFLVNLPVCLATALLLRRYVPESPRRPGHRVDLAGLLLGVVMLAGVTAGFITAGEQGWLTPLPGALLGAGLVAGLLLVRAERRQADPMLPPGLFRARNLRAATAIGVLFNLVLYGSLICLSLFLQQTRHESALSTGLLLLPMSAAVAAGSVISGRLAAGVGPKPAMLAGFTLAGAGAVLLAAAGTNGSLLVLTAGSVLLGLCSLAMPAMTAVAVGAAGKEHAGLASGVLNAARQAGGALGVAVLGALLAGGPHNAQQLTTPLAVGAGGYLLALAGTLTIRTPARAAGPDGLDQPSDQGSPGVRAGLP